MAFNKPKINKIKTDIQDLTIFLRTQRKWGKSTLFRDIIIEKYGDPECGLSVSCGKERGANLLDNLNLTEISTYKDALELKEWLIKEKGKEHNIHIISFDTVDEMIPLFEAETIRQSNIETGKKCKSINSAFGGYGNGQLYTANLIKEYFDELHQAGFGLFAISHTKFKTIKEKGGLEEDGYNVLTSNIFATYESAIGDIFDCTLTGIIDRDVVEKTIKSGDDEKVKRYATDSIRKLYFRGTPMIEAGCRMSADAVPEFMIFDKANMARDFIDTIENGMKNSKADVKTALSDTTIKKDKPSPEPVEEIDDDIDDVVDDVVEEVEDATDSDYPDNLADVIREQFKACTDAAKKKEIKTIIAEYGKLVDVDNDGLMKIYDILN